MANSKVILGLPNLPPDTLDPKIWPEFLTVYRAIENLLSGVSLYTGIDQPDAIERASMPSYQYLSGANAGQFYPTAGQAVTRGQVVSLNPTYGSVTSLANAASNNYPAIGIADETKGISQNLRVLTSGVTDAIGGMAPGTLYYLSPTPGAIQNLRPVIPGQIVQPIGWAIDSNHMLLGISSYFQQL